MINVFNEATSQEGQLRWAPAEPDLSTQVIRWSELWIGPKCETRLNKGVQETNSLIWVEAISRTWEDRTRQKIHDVQDAKQSKTGIYASTQEQRQHCSRNEGGAGLK